MSCLLIYFDHCNDMIGTSTSATSSVRTSAPSSSRSGHQLHSNQSEVCPSSTLSSTSQVKPANVKDTTVVDHQPPTKKFVDGM